MDYKSLDFLKVVEILGENSQEKILTVLAVDEKDQKAVVTFAKKPFSTEQGQKLLDKCDLKIDLKNDCYHTFDSWLPTEEQPCRYSLTYPATEHHISKARSVPTEIWMETPEMFQKVHQPFIDIQKGHLQWVYNILEKNREKCNEIDRIIFEDPDPKNGFILLPDLKWDVKDKKNLDILLLVNRRDLNTVRDLKESHLDFLQNMLAMVPKIIKEKFGLPEKELRLFFHYPPSHYHLHLHVTSTCVNVGALTERAILLQDVIENIKIKSDYYETRSLPLSLRQGQKLHSLLTQK